MADQPARDYMVPDGQPIPSALFYASEVVVQVSFNDATVILHDVMPVADKDGVSREKVARRPIAIVKLSPQSLRGIAEALQQAVESYEQTYGQLTPSRID